LSFYFLCATNFGDWAGKEKNLAEAKKLEPRLSPPPFLYFLSEECIDGWVGIDIEERTNRKKRQR
jgi:hypothetical protein